MICDKCKKFFVAGNRDGIPNGVKMVMQNNKTVTLCADCLIKLGAMNEQQRQEFIAEFKQGGNVI